MRTVGLLFLLLVTAAPAAQQRYLVTWAMEAKEHPARGEGHDFLAVFDITAGADFGKLVAFVPTPTRSMMAHHTNYAMPANRQLFANDFMAARSYVFDVRDPLKPTIATTFTNAGPYHHPHSFAYLSNGNVVGTFQLQGPGENTPGGLVELDPNGHVIRSGDAAAPQIDPYIRPYSLEVIESLDRIVSTSAPMSPLDTKEPSHVVQVWRLSDLKLLKTIALPKPKTFQGITAQYSVEALLLRDGKTVLAITGRCGLFELTDLTGTNPQAKYVYDFGGRSCSGVPVLTGKYWIQPIFSSHEIIALDVSDPAHPVEASHLYLGPEALPHWMAIEPGTGNIVITGFGSLLHRISFARVDLNTGALTLDPQSIDMTRQWPDGYNGDAIPHGTLFY
jgi:hypothetical protein